jgi:hypothetical protein
MKYLLIGIWSCCFLPVFSQNPSTVTLIFVSSTHDSYKNYEAVIDDVSYYSENTATNKESSKGEMQGSRNTIWLNNFQPGKHTIEVYSIRNGSNDERKDNTPLYSSTFTVKDGFDTKIAVRNNGQVQFSDRISAGNNNQGNVFVSDNNTPSPNNSTAAGNTPDKKMDANKNNNIDNNTSDVDRSTANNDDSFNNENTSANGRHSRKRIDTAIVENDPGTNPINTSRNNKGTNNNGGNSSDGFDNQNNNENSKAPMDDNQFNTLYETIRNQWLPGQKMKTLSNEFLNAEDNFTTSQAKKLILLVNEEGNRLKLAKSSYQCITDPENFRGIDDVLRYNASKDELDDFVSEGGRD